jgi:molybdopterin/thiamine biosynthesis adenylyltransferase
MREQMRLIAVEEAVQQAASSGDSQPVYGFIRPSEGLIQVLSAEPSCGVPLEHVGVVNPPDGSPDRGVTLPLPEGDIVLELASGLPQPDAVEIVDLTEALASRRAGSVPEAGLGCAGVVFFGGGSLGSKIALGLAEAGVRRSTAVDNDSMAASNISRHACDLLDLGRPKAIALADLFRRRGAEATPIARNILGFSDAELDDLLGGADLAIATTDSPAAQFIVNEACVRTGTPGLFVGAWELARGGELCAYRPGLTPCYYCCTGFRAELASSIAPKERRQAYQAADSERLDAEPGLGVDIAYLASVAASYALALLDPAGSRAALLAEGHGFVLLHGGSEPQAQYADLFRAPFDFVRARVRREDPCPVCGWKN